MHSAYVYELAGRLLAESMRLREIGRSDPRANRVSSVPVYCAEAMLASDDVQRAIGWVDGWWHVTGNTNPYANDLWRFIHSECGEGIAPPNHDAPNDDEPGRDTKGATS